MQTFNQWLQQYQTVNSPIGDLARAAHLSHNPPQENTLAGWQAHIAAMGGSSTVSNLLREAWQLYESAAPPPDGQSTRLQHTDEQWTIKRPMLPNWMSRVPALVHVRSTHLRDEPSEVQMVSGQVFCAAVEQLGRYFRREFHYDFRPYTAHEHHRMGDDHLQPYLFFDQRDVNDVIMRPVGACGFRYTEPIAQEAGYWYLGWVWLHPFARCSGHLSRAWPFFRQRYGNFGVRQPWSDAMAAFLRKIDHPTTEQ